MWLIAAALVIAVVLYFAYKTSNKDSTNPSSNQETIKMDLTFDQLLTYDGIKEKRTFLALKGDIYDVTGSPYYQPGTGYHAFTGRDASINLAKMSHDAQYFNKYGEIPLDEEENKVLNDWKARFDSKYQKIGKVIK